MCAAQRSKRRGSVYSFSHFLRCSRILPQGESFRTPQALPSHHADDERRVLSLHPIGRDPRNGRDESAVSDERTHCRISLCAGHSARHTLIILDSHPALSDAGDRAAYGSPETGGPLRPASYPISARTLSTEAAMARSCRSLPPEASSIRPAGSSIRGIGSEIPVSSNWLAT